MAGFRILVVVLESTPTSSIFLDLTTTVKKICYICNELKMPGIMAKIALIINERSKAGIALKELLDLLKTQPGIEIIENSNYSKSMNNVTLNSINDAISEKTESVS